MNLHPFLEVIEILSIVYILILVTQLRKLLMKLFQTVMTVNKNLDGLVKMSEFELRYEVEAMLKDRQRLHTDNENSNEVDK